MQNKQPSEEIQYITAGKTRQVFDSNGLNEFLKYGEPSLLKTKVHKQSWTWWSTHLNGSGWVVQWLSSLAAMAGHTTCKGLR